MDAYFHGELNGFAFVIGLAFLLGTLALIWVLDRVWLLLEDRKNRADIKPTTYQHSPYNRRKP